MCLITSSIFGNVTYLTKGSVAQYDGYLFDPATTASTKTKLVDLEYFHKLSDSLQKQVDLYQGIETRNDAKYGILLEQNNKLAANVQSEHTVNNLERFAYFALGVLASVVAFKVTQAITK